MFLGPVLRISASARHALKRIWLRGALIIAPLLLMPVVLAGAARWYRLLMLVVLAQLIWSSTRIVRADRKRQTESTPI